MEKMFPPVGRIQRAPQTGGNQLYLCITYEYASVIIILREKRIGRDGCFRNGK